MNLLVKAGDKQEFLISKDAICHLSITIRNMIKDSNIEDIEKNPFIDLSHIPGKFVEKIIQWCAHYYDKPDKLKIYVKGKDIELSDWDKKLFDLEIDDLLELYQISDYLEICSLTHAMAKYIAGLIELKTPEEIRQMFHIENDLDKNKEKKIVNNPFGKCLRIQIED